MKETHLSANPYEFKKVASEAAFSVEEHMKRNIHEVFEAFPVLKMIGTEEQYKEYLSTVFPESSEDIRSLIFKHRTDRSITEFEQEMLTKRNAIFFSAGSYNFGKNIIYAKLNIKNLAHAGRSVVTWSKEKVAAYQKAGFDGAYGSRVDGIVLEDRGMDAYRVEYPHVSPEDLEIIAQSRGVAISRTDIPLEEKYRELVVFRLDQVYILGSQEDANSFKQWIDTQ